MCSYLHVSCMYHVGMCTGLLAQLAERRAEPCRAAHNSKVLGSNQTFYTKHITCLSPAIGCLKWSQCSRNVMLCTLTWSRNVILCTLTFARTVSLPIHWSCAIIRGKPGLGSPAQWLPCPCLWAASVSLYMPKPAALANTALCCSHTKNTGR